MKFESRWLKVGGFDTHYLIGGEGSPVVLVHGGGTLGAEKDWEYNLQPLASHHRVYAPDLVGYGRSDRPRIDYTIRFFTESFEQFALALGLDRASFIAHSLGGSLALRFALNNPKRVERLVLIDSAGLTAEVGFIGKLLIPTFARLAKWKNDHVYASLMTGGNGGEPVPIYMNRLGEIDAPTLIVWGAWDGYTSVKFARLAHDRLRKSRLGVFPRCWHSPHRQRAEDFNRLVLEFLNEPN